MDKHHTLRPSLELGDICRIKLPPEHTMTWVAPHAERFGLVLGFAVNSQVVDLLVEGDGSLSTALGSSPSLGNTCAPRAAGYDGNTGGNMRNLTAAMVIRGNPTPDGFRKGDILRPARQGTAGFLPNPLDLGWRRLTPEERAAWYERHYADVKAGRDSPFDSAGESRLAPQDAYVPLREDRTYEVIRGRVEAPEGYGTSKGCCEVVDMLDGTRFFCKRKAMVRA